MKHVFEISIESKDQYALNAVTWYIGQKIDVTSATAVIVNARDSSPTILNMAKGHGYLEAYNIWYLCEESSEAYCTDSKPELWRKVTLKGENESDVHSFVKEALVAYRQCLATLKASEGVTIYAWDDHDGWISVGDAPRRPIESLFLPHDAAEKLLRELKAFVSPKTHQQYAHLNVPLIKIIMLHGTPGSGKTSLVRCLASELGISIANYAGSDMETFSDAILQAPPKSIVAVEDIDCILGASNGNQREKRGFSQLLNALDAVYRKDPLIVCLTTNSPGSLDVAVRRRVDHCIEFKHAVKTQCLELIQRFFPTFEDTEKLWCHLTQDGCRAITMAMLQKFLVRSMKYGSPWDLLRDDPEAFTSLIDVVANTSNAHHIYT